jgi:NADH-ubiquinone oxidoreductase chain 5
MYLLTLVLALLAYYSQINLFIMLSVIITLALVEIQMMGSSVILLPNLNSEWFYSLGLSVEWSILFDGLTVSMLVAIMAVSLLVQLYSLSYMAADPHLIRFIGYLSLFTFAMTLLVTADNLMVLFMGWEFVGIASYLLINFWFTRKSANHAAMKAFLLNRVGDWALALGLLLMMALLYDFSTAAIFTLVSYINADLLLLISLLLIVGASAKSALTLLGLHLWLPNAMEGPTPVSALIHAATMVTAGIYLFIRLGPLFECNETALLIITWLGALGSLLGAMAGLLANDMKRVIAYSTMSQLGYMTVACGSSQYSIALFHLINHAFFKALLFLSAGAIIHAFDEQDLRKMGSLGLLLPWTYDFVLLGSLSMMAFPFMTGFYSKDFLLDFALMPKNISTTIATLLLMLAAILTATYSTRLMILTFIGQPNSNFKFNVIAADDYVMWLPLAILYVGAALFGFIAHELFLHGAIPLSLTLYVLEGQPLIQLISWFILYTAYLVVLLSIRSFQFQFHQINNIIIINNHLVHWHYYNGYFVKTSQTLSLMVSRYWDRGLIELVGPLGLHKLFHFATFKLELLSTGFIPHTYFTLLIIMAAVITLIMDRLFFIRI